MVSFARVGRVNVSEWEPATDAEKAMRDALRTDDQESYFRILAGVDLLLPVSADALAGLAPLGWGTWSTRRPRCGRCSPAPVGRPAGWRIPGSPTRGRTSSGGWRSIPGCRSRDTSRP